ncbi:toll/interleukin-1 receptor domain-containing protein [Clostridium aquiflavi]|uniref:Toll/interleukin-1 receptor domain-containing protein n=1 Tax=Clostridium aquiflavi TaxID=3073603 RepID=A0ABU1EJG7_9CLOT|nr:toll/interleukin-1 receptor domain-containing protein [Clostridium sp. 5N-1]MDR5588537.1 toll/interleukin-1 receptor domain-containing protein [Clostridium sp. 5N-1]
MQLENLKKIEVDFNKWKISKIDGELSCIQPRILCKELSISEEEADDFLSILVNRGHALRVFTGKCPNKECEEEFYIDSSQMNEKYECDICGTSFKISDGSVKDIEVYYDLIEKNNKIEEISTSVNYKDKYFGQNSKKNKENAMDVEYFNKDNVIHIQTNQDIKNTESKKIRSKELSVFISHNEKDDKLAEAIIKLLEALGISKNIKDGKIFCSSANNRGVSIGEDIFEQIRNKFDDNIIVLFLFTKRFFESPACLCEMGAAWVKSKNVVPLVMPPQKFEDIKGIFNKNIKGFLLNDEKKFTELVDFFIQKFNLPSIDFKDYDEIKNSFFENIQICMEKNNN